MLCMEAVRVTCTCTLWNMCMVSNVQAVLLVFYVWYLFRAPSWHRYSVINAIKQLYIKGIAMSDSIRVVVVTRRSFVHIFFLESSRVGTLLSAKQ